MSVWVAFPSCNAERAKKASLKWRAKGYRIAILTDDSSAGYAREAIEGEADISLHVAEYPGYFRSVNMLAKAAIAMDLEAQAVVLAADDMMPDPDLTASAICAQFIERFPAGLGVMQPIGDDLPGTDRICGSPWVGRGWIMHSYAGEGPTCGEFFHFYGDELLKVDAERIGLLWQRPDLTQRHEHWMRPEVQKLGYQQKNSDEHWASDQRTFKRLMAARGAE